LKQSWVEEQGKKAQEKEKVKVKEKEKSRGLVDLLMKAN
jgi:hypothetical protein